MYISYCKVCLGLKIIKLTTLKSTKKEGISMNKVFRVLLVFVLMVTSITTVFADEIITDSNEVLRAYPCDECSNPMVQSNKTMSIFAHDVQIPCGCVDGTPDVGADFKIYYDVYNTYVCSSCGYTLPRNKIGQQIKYWCIEASRFYNPATGQKIGDECLEYKTQNREVGILAEVCSECNRGSLLANNDLILSFYDYTVTSRTVPCKEYPDWRKDEVWKFYFYNTWKCNYCGTLYERNKTQFYEEWGFCAHGGGGKYPLNIINKTT